MCVFEREREREIEGVCETEEKRGREGGLMFDTLKLKDMSSSRATRAEGAGQNGQVNVGVSVVGV